MIFQRENLGASVNYTTKATRFSGLLLESEVNTLEICEKIALEYFGQWHKSELKKSLYCQSKFTYTWEKH